MLGLGLRLGLARQVPIGSVFAYASYALALDFKNILYGQGGSQAANLAAVAGYAYTRTGSKREADLSGPSALFAANAPAIVPGIGYYADQSTTNLLLNAGSSTDLVTQDVTVTAQAYTISFYGTGTVTLSGVSTAGPLVGTGANNRVSLVFTPTAGTLTVTVSGSVKYAELSAGNAAAAIVPTAGATATAGEDQLAVNLKSDGSALTDQDMIVFVRCASPDIVTAVGRYALQIDDGTTSNRLLFWCSTANPAIIVVNSGSLDQKSFTASTANVEEILVLRRVGTAWSSNLYRSGALVGWQTHTTTLFPVGMTKAKVGNNVTTGNPFRGIEKAVGIKFGTFSTDAAVIAAITVLAA